ncbi:MAG: DNA methyltransferase [Gallionella sp.]|nr:DNA methyltransferase [Gallionella sp.]
MNPVIIGNAELWLGDCLEILPTLPKVDAVIADPPYGIGYSPSGGGKGAFGKPVYKRFTGVDVVRGDDKPFDPEPFILIAPKVILWGANHYAPRLPASACWLIWDKREAESTLKFADCEMAWTNLPGQARIFRHLWNGVAKASESGEPRVHPTQKPIALMTWCLKQAGNPASVLDPFMGSGTLGIAAAQAGCAYTGIEIDAHHFETACERIENAQRQQRMFA